MNYLELPADELVALAEEFRKKYGLIIPEEPSAVIFVGRKELAEDYAEVNWFKPVYRISLVKNGTKEFVAFRNSKYLIVTNGEDLDYFFGLRLVAERVGFKFWQMFAQLCRENDLIVPEW